VTTGILILAAGFSRRFGSDKRNARLADGRGLLLASVASALSSGLPVRVCLRDSDTALSANVEAAGASVIPCANAAIGMGATLAEGVSHCSDWDGLLVALGDMPDIQPDSYSAIAAALGHAPLCRPEFAGQPGHPVGFRRELFTDLRQLSGDEGARSVLQRHRELLKSLALDDPGILRDIDRPADLD